VLLHRQHSLWQVPGRARASRYAALTPPRLRVGTKQDSRTTMHVLVFMIFSLARASCGWRTGGGHRCHCRAPPGVNSAEHPSFCESNRVLLQIRQKARQRSLGVHTCSPGRQTERLLCVSAPSDTERPRADQNGGSRAGSEHRPATLRDSACRVGPRQSRLGRTIPAGTARLVPGIRGQLPGRQAERFRMGPAVVLGQDLAEAAGPVRDGAAANLAARDRKTGNGHRETAGIGLAHRLHVASPARRTLRPPGAGRAADPAAVGGPGPRSYRPTPQSRLSFVERPVPASVTSPLSPVQRCRASQLWRNSREISSRSQRQKRMFTLRASMHKHTGRLILRLGHNRDCRTVTTRSPRITARRPA
jgi:hypothetical protein